MQYRKFRRMDRENSLLGMGVMRLPQDEEGRVDSEEGVRLIRYAIDKGINYIDTGFTYHGGRSERIIGEALKDGYRDKVILADKMPIWLVKSEEDVDRYFNKQLKRLDVDCIDMYLVHNIIPANWKKTKKYNVLPYLEKQKAEGRIGHIGFSFHGDLDLFKEVIDAYDWEFCQIQLNYLDKDEQATLEGLEYARSKGIDVIVMEPLKGGRITDKVPDSVQKIWDDAVAAGTVSGDRTPAEWAFRWVASQPGVSLILSGMNSTSQLDENIAIFSRDDLTEMSEEELAVIDRVAEEYNSKIKYQCTGCGYCMPCPKKLDIPGVIRYLNNWYAFDKNPSTRMEYDTWLGDGFHGSDCIQCGECEKKCPQSLPIPAIMREAAEEFGK
ncbi:MAG: aldo/keto reductase [Clostridiales bacterium]|nr:aldo/keto reductase [Clostridiales bacterium]MDD7035194.1 aldo/keto reductase [Bacillota bacterium]MDY2920040.1 aldo/keto reductase [Lentihominibacter sp.]